MTDDDPTITKANAMLALCTKSTISEMSMAEVKIPSASALRRAAAKQAGIRRYMGDPCRRGHSGLRLVSTNSCIECQRMSEKKWKAGNKDKIDEHKAKNKEKYLEYSRKWLSKNPGIRKEEYKTRRRVRGDEFVESGAMRRARKHFAVPKWLTDEQRKEIKAFYLHAKDCEAVSGQRYDVDHIVPLDHPDVCGLHVPWNLQVLPKDVNIRKGRSFQSGWEITVTVETEPVEPTEPRERMN